MTHIEILLQKIPKVRDASKRRNMFSGSKKLWGFYFRRGKCPTSLRSVSANVFLKRYLCCSNLKLFFVHIHTFKGESSVQRTLLQTCHSMTIILKYMFSAVQKRAAWPRWNFLHLILHVNKYMLIFCSIVDSLYKCSIPNTVALYLL